MLIAAVIATITLGITCAWQRRHLWNQPEERAVTTAVLLMPIGLTLIYPTQEHYLGQWLHNATGLWYLNDYLALVALMIAVAQLFKSTALRLPAINTPWVTQQVNQPTAAAAACMLLLLATSNITHRPTWPGPIMDLPVGSLWSTWFIYAVTEIWCLTYLLYLLYLLRDEVDDPWTTNWFIACAVTAITTEGIVITAQYTSALFEARWYGTLLAITFGCIGSMKAWINQRRKEDA